MQKLGVWPQDQYYSSWMTQRLANRAPEWTKARMWSWSVLQQMLNPLACDMERVNKQLVEERNNIFLSATNMSLIEKLYFLELSPGMEFNSYDNGDGIAVYEEPTVKAFIDDTEFLLTHAKYNSIENLFYNSIPSRVEDGEESYAYSEVIPSMSISSLADESPNELSFPGHLYITIRDNNTWEYRARNRIYYPKVFIRGLTRKGTYQEESVPIRYNGTFKTINQWDSVNEVFVSYLDETAEITIEALPFARDTQIDTQNLLVKASGLESWRFVRIENNLYGSLMVSEGFTVNTLDVVRKGFNDLDYEYRIELQDDFGNPVFLDGIVLKPNSDYAFCIDSDNLYVYNTKLPYPDLTTLDSEHPDTKMDIYSDRWIYSRGDIVTLETDTLDVTSIPWKIRWHLLEPDGTESYILADGTKVSTSTSAETWIENPTSTSGVWKEHKVELLVEQTGSHIITLETFYSDVSNSNNRQTYTTKFMYYIPAIKPEITIPLSDSLTNCNKLAFDSDDRLWFYNGGSVFLSDVFYDYFIVDYESKKVFLREDYSSVKVVL